MYSLYMHPQTHRSLTQAREFMRHAYSHPVSLPDVASRANLSPYHFLRVHKLAYGETPHEFLTRLRIEKAKTLLARGSHNVTEACFEVGFSSMGSFSNLFAYRVGLSPSEYRRYARSTISFPTTVRSLFVPSCFFTMLYGTEEERNIREAVKAPPIVSSEYSSEREVSRDPTPEPLYDLRDRPGRSPQVLPRPSGLRGQHRHAHGRLGASLADAEPERPARPRSDPGSGYAWTDVRSRDGRRDEGAGRERRLRHRRLR